VRLALLTLSAETDDLGAAETQVKLAEQELQLAQDRYSAGAGDNIQVVTAPGVFRGCAPVARECTGSLHRCSR